MERKLLMDLVACFDEQGIHEAWPGQLNAALERARWELDPAAIIARSKAHPWYTGWADRL